MNKKVLIVVLAASLFALSLPGPANAFDLPLACEANDPNRPANGAVAGAGTHEHWVLQLDMIIPSHENRCPQTGGKVTFTEAPDDVAIEALTQRRVLFVGLNQALGMQDWAEAWRTYTAPLMIDGFVVTANIPCSTGGNVLKLDPVSLGAIYSGVATRWNDRLLLQQNPWLQNCGATIKVSIRQDEAWSSNILKDYLSKRNPLFTQYRERGRLDEWPGTLTVGCGGSSETNMASCAFVAGSISYMRYATAVAYGLTPVKLANGNNNYDIAPAPNGEAWPRNCIDAAMAGNVASPDKVAQSPWTGPAGENLDWSTYSMTYNPSGYGLCGMALITTQSGAGAGAHQTITDAWKDHMKVMWGDTVQDRLPDYGYAPIPEVLQNTILGGPIIAG